MYNIINIKTIKTDHVSVKKQNKIRYQKHKNKSRTLWSFFPCASHFGPEFNPKNRFSSRALFLICVLGPESVARDGDFHSFLLISQANGTLVLSTEQELQQVTDTEFYTRGPTLCCGHILGRQRTVQIYSLGVLVLSGGILVSIYAHLESLLPPTQTV